MTTMPTQLELRPEYVHHGQIGVLVDGEDLSMDQWIEEMEAEPALMLGLALAALFGILLGMAWGMLYFYILHWGMK